MIVTGECTACRRAFVARGRRPSTRRVEWKLEPSDFRCTHESDLFEAIGLAAVRPGGRATVGPVRARREEDFTPWDLTTARGALPEWGLYRNGELIVTVQAGSANTARAIFMRHGIGRQGDRIRRRS
jgi:hypothetical protein